MNSRKKAQEAHKKEKSEYLQSETMERRRRDFQFTDLSVSVAADHHSSFFLLMRLFAANLLSCLIGGSNEPT
jgi:hypothetical protein